jgi:ubiquinone/menaquinone biosynthesis C-methylase UbiE
MPLPADYMDLNETDLESQSFPTSGDEEDDLVDGCAVHTPYRWHHDILADTSSTSSSSNTNDAGSNSTKSLTNSVWTFYRENGRTYHGYRSGSERPLPSITPAFSCLISRCLTVYPFPNDASETERLDFQYALLSHLLENKPHLAPLTSPRHVLDIGTGTGTWAIEMGDMYPNATIEATDLSPIQPTAVPGNVQFLIDDAEQADWAVPIDYYDFVHTRMMLGCFQDFKAIIAHAFMHLKPGGWMESQEIMSNPQCDDGTMPDDWPFKEWTKYLDDAAMAVGRPLRIANKLKRWYAEVGFVDIQEKVIKIPVNTWPRDPDLKPLGKWWQQNILLGLQGFSLAHFTRVLGWSKDEIEVSLGH